MGDGDSITLRDLVARNIRRERARLNISQETLADRAGLHRTYIGAVERSEKNISIDSIERIAKALELEPHLLMTGRDDEAAS